MGTALGPPTSTSCAGSGKNEMMVVVMMMVMMMMMMMMMIVMMMVIMMMMMKMPQAHCSHLFNHVCPGTWNWVRLQIFLNVVDLREYSVQPQRRARN